MRLNAQEVLSEYNISFSVLPDEKLQVECSYHDDKNPSGVIFLNTGIFHCPVCNKNKHFLHWMSTRLKRNVYFEVHKKFADSADKVVNPEAVENFHAEIFQDENKLLLQQLHKRGIKDALIRDFRIGCSGERISIPIRNQSGFYVNVRLYKPGDAKRKYINFSKFGKPPRWFPIDQLLYDTVVLHGGELKALSVLRSLNEADIGSITSTHGEGNLPNELVNELDGKKVYICMDIDDAGCKAARELALKVRQVASWVGIVELPLDIRAFPKGDVNDYLLSNSPQDFVKIVQETKEFEYVPETKYSVFETPLDTTLTESVHAKYAEKRVTLKAVVSTLDISPYSIPKKVNVLCDRSEKFCSLCPVSGLMPEKQIMELSAESPALIKMIGEKDETKRKACMEALAIPKMCKKCSFDTIEHFNIEEAKLSEELDLQSSAVERSMQTAYCIGPHLELNECYKMTGRMFPHPNTQQATLLISSYTTVEDALSTYQCDETEDLKLFQPKEWTKEALEEKLCHIYTDMEANVTRIFQRRNLHLVYDLAYHSPLWITFDGKQIKGWAEVLVVGDSSQGKSEAVLGMMRHYNLGERVDCKGATRAGLLGGSENFNKRWFVTWGKIPINDKRLVVLEEVKGASVEVIAKLTDMRSSGFAEVAGIVKRKTQARTRLIAISNPRSTRSISGYNYGIDALVELIGSLEDLRRFDMALILERNEVDVGELEWQRPSVPHEYNGDLCRRLILWAWTTGACRFERERTVLEASKSLTAEFTDEIPIVDRGSMRLKIARLSAALAARTFSEVDGHIFVRDCHVEYIRDFLRDAYSTSAFGYHQYTQKVRKSEDLLSDKAVRARIEQRVEHPGLFVEHLLFAEEIDVFFISDVLGMPPEDARNLLSFFILQRALKKEGKSYRKTTGFTRLLKEMSETKEKDERPEFLK